MNSSTELLLNVNGNSVTVIDSAGASILEATLSIAEVKIASLLFENKDIVIEKEKLILIGWSGKPVSSSALTVAISNIRGALKDSDIKIKNIPRLGYVMNISDNKDSRKLGLLTDNEESEIIISGKVLHERQHQNMRVNLDSPSITEKWKFRNPLRKIICFFLALMAMIFIVSILMVYFYESASTLCLPKQDVIVCTSDDPDFDHLSMPIEFDIESFIHQAFEDN